MCLEGLDGTFRCIAAMNIWGHKLESCFPCLCHDSARFLACFVVKHLYVHRVSPFTEAYHDAAVGHNAVAVMTVLKGFNQDGSNVAMECEHYVAVTRVGVDRKPSHIISIYFNDRLNDNK